MHKIQFIQSNANMNLKKYTEYKAKIYCETECGEALKKNKQKLHNVSLQK
jgi:hypothetical protein